jgi:NADPH:quinone reductase-like Zn-dependent oxidoreductase
VIQLAKLSGFSPIITTASHKHASELTSLGATHVVPRDDPLTSALLSSITSVPLSLAYDAVGVKATQQAAYDLLAPGGILLTVEPDSTEKGDERGRKVMRFFASPWPEPQRALGRDAYKALAGYLEQGLIKVCCVRKPVCDS